jgi:hypothetical protein
MGEEPEKDLAVSMATARPLAAKPTLGRPTVHPLFIIGCGLALMLGAALVYWLEPGPMAAAESPQLTREAAEAAAARSLQRAREREAAARAEMERRAAEEAADRARRAALLADAAAESEARKQREEFARQQAAAEQARRATADTEDAWKRFYQPSAACREAQSAATVECVNEFVKAKREFQARQAALGR